MRLDGVAGLALGGLLLYFPRDLLATWGLYTGGPVWPWRTTGALLLALGLHLLIAAQERIIRTATMTAMVVGNLLVALVLLVAYFQREFAGLNWVGQAVLVLVFLICLISAVAPLRFLRIDYT
jgi:hypothetical protein